MMETRVLNNLRFLWSIEEKNDLKLAMDIFGIVVSVFRNY